MCLHPAKARVNSKVTAAKGGCEVNVTKISVTWNILKICFRQKSF